MQLLVRLEADAALRRIPVYLVDFCNGYQQLTGITPSSILISKNGAAPVPGVGSFVETGNGLYYYEATQSELDILGFFNVRVVDSGVTRVFMGMVQIVTFNFYSSIPEYVFEAVVEIDVDDLDINIEIEDIITVDVEVE